MSKSIKNFNFIDQNKQQQIIVQNFKNKMTSTYQYQQDNISIQIDPTIFDKPDSQLTQQLYEMARKIAESDRNNDMLRQAKKTKSFEIQAIKKNKKDLEDELETYEKGIKVKKNMENQNVFKKNNRIKFQQMNKYCEELQDKQKNMLNSNIQIQKESDKLQKKLAALEIQYQNIMKENKIKANAIKQKQKLKQQKQQLIKQNQQRIQQLEIRCQKTKSKAEELQSQLKKQLANEQQLQQLIMQREIQLQEQMKQRKEANRKKQQNKKTITKMTNIAKTIRLQIEQKKKQFSRLAHIHDSLLQKTSFFQQQQRKLQQLLLTRRSALTALKQMPSSVPSDNPQHSYQNQ